MRHVLDASALVAYLGQERGHEMIADLLADAAKREEPLLMGAANWGEVLCTMAGRIGSEKASKVAAVIGSFPIDIVPVDKLTAERAAEFKTKLRLSYVDGLAAALADFSGAELLTADQDFSVAKNSVRVRFIR